MAYPFPMNTFIVDSIFDLLAKDTIPKDTVTNVTDVTNETLQDIAVTSSFGNPKTEACQY